MKKLFHKIMPACMSALLMFMVALLVVMPMALMTGCTKADVVDAIDTLETQLPQVAQMASGLMLLIAPEYAPLVGPGAAQIASDGKLIESLLVGYNPSTPNPNTLGKVNAAWLDIQNNLQGMLTAVGVKDQKTTAIVTTFAGLIGLIVQNVATLVKSSPPAVAASLEKQLPSVFGWHVRGMDMVAFTAEVADGSAAPSAGSSANPKIKARDIALQWNRIANGQPKAKIPVPRKHILGIPVPFIGSK